MALTVLLKICVKICFSVIYDIMVFHLIPKNVTFTFFIKYIVCDKVCANYNGTSRKPTTGTIYLISVWVSAVLLSLEHEI